MEKMKKTAQWAIGCFLAGIGILMIRDNLLPGCLFCLSGIILIPPVTGLVPQFRYRRHAIIIAVVLLALYAGSMLPK